MQPLHEVIDDVRSGRRPPWPCHPKQCHQAQERALIEVATFGTNPGNLRMLKFVPRRLGRSSPLVVVLHGCAQTAVDMDIGGGWSELASRSGFAVLFAEQRQANNSQRGFNWFRSGDTRRDAGEALSIRQMVEVMIRDHDLDRKRVFVVGLSAGGAMASALLASYSDVFAGGAIIAGLPSGIASNVWEAFGAMTASPSLSGDALGDKVRAAHRGHAGAWPRISVWHGSADTTVSPSNAEAIVKQWCNVHALENNSKHQSCVQGQTRQSWRNRSGRTMIEYYAITGLAHAVPVDRAGKNGGRIKARFFEDVAISSTHRIAEFWGLKIA